MLRLLWAGPVALGVCYFALWACAPLFSHPSPTPIPQAQENQLGLAGGYAARLPGVRAQCGDEFIPNGCPGPNFQLYYRHRFKSVELVGLAHGGAVTTIGSGVLVRGYLYESDGFRVGLGGSVGFIYAQAGIPIAGRLANNVWLYSEPMAAFSVFGTGRVPVGLSFTPGRTTIELEGALLSALNGSGPIAAGSLSLGYAF